MAGLPDPWPRMWLLCAAVAGHLSDVMRAESRAVGVGADPSISWLQ